MSSESIEFPEGLFIYRTQTHFDDLDGLWVMHHSRYLVHLERAVMALFNHAMNAEVFDPERYPDLYQVVRKVEIDYLQPIDEVMSLAIALSVARVREAGLALRFAFLDETLETVYARGMRTCCRLSQRTHQPVGWSTTFRSAYTKLCEAASRFPVGWGKCFGKQ